MKMMFFFFLSGSSAALLLSDLSLLLSPLSEQQIYTAGLSLVVSRRFTTTPSRQRPWQTPLPVYYFKIKQRLVKSPCKKLPNNAILSYFEGDMIQSGNVPDSLWRLTYLCLATWRDDVTRGRFWSVWELSGELEQKPDLITILSPLHPIISIISVMSSDGM